MLLTDAEKRRYARQTILPEVGEEGQEKLKKASVLVVGAGGLGSSCLLYLAASGIGNLTIIDGDRVDLSNLQRQIIHETSDIDRPKSQSAADAISDLNPEINLNVISENITLENAKKILTGHNVVIDGSDNIETRFMVHDFCYNLKIPYLTAAIEKYSGQLSIFKGYEDDKPCYRCLYPENPPADAIPKCSENGILGPVAGIMGSWQAVEAIKEILGIGESTAGNLIIVNTLNIKVKKVNLPKDEGCKFCQKSI